MEFGISCARVDEVGLVSYAESLGYNFCWATDSPMLRSNPFAVLALAAQATRWMRLGIGVAVPGLREAPELANGIATINRLAPGRTFLGVGTGNTAMRTLGRPPVKIKAFGQYIRVVRALLDGDEARYESAEGAHPVRFQNLADNSVAIEPRIPIEIGGFGPRSQSLAGELGDGLITSIPRGGSIGSAWSHVRQGAERVGRKIQNFSMTALVNVLMLKPGESLASERVIRECGPAIMANVHYLVDFVRETGAEPPDYVLPIWEEYLAFHKTRDSATSHQALHDSHYSYLDAEESRFITPQMIRNFCVAGAPDEIVERLQTLEEEGLTAVSFIPPNDERMRMYEDFARYVIAEMD